VARHPIPGGLLALLGCDLRDGCQLVDRPSRVWLWAHANVGCHSSLGLLIYLVVVMLFLRSSRCLLWPTLVDASASYDSGGALWFLHSACLQQGSWVGVHLNCYSMYCWTVMLCDVTGGQTVHQLCSGCCGVQW
jgi:hypothetical protein